MIDQTELPIYMQKVLPELSGSLKGETCKNVYSTVRLLSDYTHDNIATQNFKNVKKCFVIAEKLYNKGNEAVKTAIENVYVYSFSHMLFIDEARKRILLGLIPITLYTLYVKQMLNSHI
jgi:hypothetical protein